MASPIQVVSTTTTAQSGTALTATTWTDLPGLSAAITPASASNDVLIRAVVNGDRSAAVPLLMRIMRDATPIALGVPAASEVAATARILEFTTQFTALHVDSPSATVSTNYKFQAYSTGAGQTVYLNRDFIGSFAGRSTIVLTELG